MPRSFAFDLPKKVRRLGLRVALSARMREGKCAVIQSEALKEGKTQYLRTLLSQVDACPCAQSLCHATDA